MCGLLAGKVLATGRGTGAKPCIFIYEAQECPVDRLKLSKVLTTMDIEVHREALGLSAYISIS